MVKSLLLLAGLASLPTLTFAQSAADTPGFYLGLGTSILTSKPFRQRDADALVGPALTAGIPLSPHVAVELSMAYAWRNTHSAYSYFDYGTSRPAVNSTDKKLQVYTFPLLVRATLSPPASRVHADLLGGVMYLRSTSYAQYTATAGGVVVRQDADQYATNRLNLTLGPALRFALTPRWEVAADALVNYYFADGGNASFSDHLFLNARGGVHYTFPSR